ncbi:MAG TPA: metallophosphoesterase [Caulobacteraceae bacterium]|jgi:3',5'-cyclic AMP phosphodiesterase CpdA|nr:metallophosphoesterase [Caulobacteraceae bacterium]
MTDPIDRRGFLRCAGWAGGGALYAVSGGMLSSVSFDEALAAPARAFTFAQISDSHIGFDKPANPDVKATLRAAIAKLHALPTKPDFVLHTGDISHLSTEAQFAEAQEILSEIGLPIFFTPGEHDTLDDGGGALYLARFGKGTKGAGWQSFDHGGVHFVGLVNVVGLQAGGMAHLGPEQIAWLKNDLAAVRSSTPLVVFVHIPLWTVWEPWGWGTDDALPALALMRRFGSVTVLNGHIHQILQKSEGNITFHTARSTAYPQPAPGAAPAPGPLKVPADQLPAVLGVREARLTRGRAPIALIDSSLA